LSLAQALLSKGQVREGAAQLAAAIQLAPEYADAHYLLALVLASQGDTVGVVEHYSKAVALNPALDTSINLHDLLGAN